MSMTKEDGAPVGERLRENEEGRPSITDMKLKAGQSKPAPDEIDEIISYFEENMQVDGLPSGRQGEAEYPDIETYIGDKLGARDFIIDKIQALIDREFRRQHKR